MMKRVLGILVGASLSLVIGCAQQYDLRLEKTIENKKYQQRLDNNLEPAPQASNLKTANVYVRPPLGLKGPAKTFALVVVEPGKFDVADSFIGADGQAGLHILARDNRPKAKPKSPPKKGPAPAEEEAPPPATRGDFTTDVLELLKAAYNTDFDTSQLKTETRPHPPRNNSYKTKTLELSNKDVQVYLYGDKNSQAQVALIFEGPKEWLHDNSSKIALCLESFGVGREAENLYAGKSEMAGDEGASAPPGGVF